MTFSTISLNEVINASQEENDKEISSIIFEGISAFECEESSYHERFIKAAASEKCSHNVSRTYLIINEEALAEYPSNQAIVPQIVSAYFTVGLSSLRLDNKSIGKKKRRDLSNHQYKRHETIGCFVIGELCRSTNLSKDKLPGVYILNECMDII